MTLQEQFEQLVAELKQQYKQHELDPEQMFTCDTMYRLIHLGPSVAPLILARLKLKEDFFLCSLLAQIAREIIPGCIIPEKDIGNLERVTELTVSWLKTKFPNHAL